MSKRKDADTRFREMIDLYNCVDVVFKEFEREREALRKKLRNIIRRRGRGYHNGNESSIHAYDVLQKRLSAELVRKVLKPTSKQMDKCYKPTKYIQIDGGHLLTPAKEVPEMGPPVEVNET